MSRTKITIAIALAAVALSGCSSFNLGAFCYVPAAGGQCVASAIPASDAAIGASRK